MDNVLYLTTIGPVRGTVVDSQEAARANEGVWTAAGDAFGSFIYLKDAIVDGRPYGLLALPKSSILAIVGN